MQRDVEVTLRKSLFGVDGGVPLSAIPHDHRPAAIFALGDVALEIEVLHRMILGANREPLFADDQARPACHRPALERTAELEPQIVVQPPGVVLLDDELPAVALAAFRLGFRRATEIALLPVVLERIPARRRS